MRRLLFVASAALLLAAVTSAAGPAGPVGSVSSSSALTLRGARVPVEGVPNWPLMLGDELATSASIATVIFKDGSQAILSKNTRALVEEVDGRPTVRLLSGGLERQTRAGGPSSEAAGVVRRGPPPPPHAPPPTSRR